MGRTPLATVIRLVSSMADTAGGQDLEDAQLLQRYVRRRDGDAFAVLVRRHGRLVWSVCRRILRNEADAEDAFQATFLALALHASRIRAGCALASWLYRVAHRVAAKALRERDTRQANAGAAQRSVCAQPNDELCGRELQALVDEELQRLPEKYRTPFLLCCLEGKSKSEAARQLGWKEGTVSGRLAEARKRMRCNLLRRGVTPLAAATAVALEHAAAAVPGILVSNTIRMTAGAAVALVPANIAQLAEGACTAMNTKKWIVVCVLLVSGLVAGGAGWMSHTKGEARAAAPAARAEIAPPTDEPPPPIAPAPRPLDRLDLALHRWHAAMNRVKSATCEIMRTDKDNVFNTEEVFQGTLQYLKSDECWALEMHKKSDPQDFNKIVRAGKDVYVYAAQTKEVHKCQWPLGWSLSQFTFDPLFALFSGMNAAQAKERFEWKLIKEDQWYVYLGIEPRSKKDKATFLFGRLVLLKDSHLPRQVWFQKSEGMAVTWNITKLDTAARLKKEDFAPKIPAGWRLVVMDQIEVVPGIARIRSLGLTVLTTDLSAQATVVPGSLNLGTIKAGTTVKRRVVVRAEKPFRITDIDGPAELTFTPELDTTARTVHRLTLEYQPVKPGRFVCEVKIKTDLEGAPLIVKLEGVVKP
jgi:TIGR03009 family protein